ncbi:MAG: membrane protein insertase YidC [Lachnospiraceae bacterium]|nr:membrane protein insertase YidC [Lachnospiraceae bacterium]
MISETFFNIFIQPLVLVIEFIFTIMSRWFGNYGIAIILVSVVINFLILPLYKRSDALQEQERRKQKEMEPWVKHIRKTFRGDEQFMMLSTYYRQQNYQPVNAIRGSLSLLLQIPFFMAAYHFLTHVNLQGESFLFLKNLGEADRLLKIGGVSLNVMPILMTLINVISGFIYTKGFRLKDKLQLYVLAGVFLVVLYQSPSGLVLYWTMNNLFSLLKNVVMKLLEPRLKKNISKKPAQKEVKTSVKSFLLGALLLTFLMGLVIPVSVVSASPAEFISLNAYRNPLFFVWLTFCVAAGVFLVWGGILYYVSSPAIKVAIEKIFCVLAVVGVADYMLFGNRTGTVSPLLTYHEGLFVNLKTGLLSLLVAAVLAGVVWLCWRYQKVLQTLIGILAISLLGLGGWNVASTCQELEEIDYIRSISEEESAMEVSPILTLSKTGKNVVVFMLDRAISDYFPYIMAEKPELAEQFSGFVYYPNTISFGQYTIYASASIFGGYEYTPAQMNARSDIPAVEKQNEALKVLPVLFSGLDYDVTVCDPPLAGYREISDLSIYNDYPEIDTHITMGAYMGDDERYVKRIQDSQERNFFCYSIMKAAPVLFQRFIYDEGNYFEATKNNTQSPAFMESYSVLTNLSGLTDIQEDSVGGFVMINNETPHEPCLLQMPDYVPADSVNNGAYEDSGRFTLDGRVMKMDNSYQLEHYHVNMATYVQIGKWLDYLKECGVYDNTRIIIVADHGRTLGQFDDLLVSDELDVEGYHPILLVKDFDAEEFSVSDKFMTNADVPVLALEGLISQPVNPFTGNPITDAAKKEGNLLITTADQFDQNPGNTIDTESGVWYTITGGNVFDKSNWQKVKQ